MATKMILFVTLAIVSLAQINGFRFCAKRCTLEINPVCGRNENGDIRLFLNKCQFENTQCSFDNENWQQTRLGECSHLMNGLQLTSAKKPCAKPCTDNIDPVCAVNNLGQKSNFSTLCDFENVQTCFETEKEWKLLNKGFCEEVEKVPSCAKPCTFIYDPVCGVNNLGQKLNFSSSCVFENTQKCFEIEKEWKFLYKGECKELPKCPKGCPLNLDPVCAVNNQGKKLDFPNLCDFENTQTCLEPEKEWKLLHKGNCKEQSTCEKPCPKNLEPLCAVNNQGQKSDFSNSCVFKNVQQCTETENEWKFLNWGDCEELVSNDASDLGLLPRKCFKLCEEEPKPVCAQNTNGKMLEFHTKCMFDIWQCSKPKENWQIIKNSSCTLESINLCARRCTEERKPVCAKSKDGSMKTFYNKCSFQNTQCAHVKQQWIMLGEGECEKVDLLQLTANSIRLCARRCPLDDEPVCGVTKDGITKTFKNKCFFENVKCSQYHQNWDVLSNNRCEKESTINIENLIHPERKLCAKLCPKNYEPICARATDGSFKTFNNKCLLEIGQCSEPDLQWEMVSSNKCETSNMLLAEKHLGKNLLCAKRCPLDDEPVCGRAQDGTLKTYKNKCFLENAKCSQVDKKWELVSTGKCQQSQMLLSETKRILCAKQCPLEKTAVCGKSHDGTLKTFRNKCFFENVKCSQTYNKWELASSGKCEDSVMVHAERNLIKKSNLLCAKRCSTKHEPVCGRSQNGNVKQFYNKCMFENTQCSQVDKKWQLVKCQNENIMLKTRLCARACTLENAPICVLNEAGQLVDFPNKCMFENYQCSHSDINMTIFKEGECFEN